MAVAYQDYYKILKVERNATQSEIQKAYRRLARKYHPDVNKEKGAEDEFKKINEAYEVLKDPQTRSKYDQLGSNWKAGEPFSARSQAQGFDFSEAFSGSGFSSFFDMLFGQGRQSAASQQNPYGDFSEFEGIEQEATIEVSLEDSLSGIEKEIILKPKASSDKERKIKVRIPKGVIDKSRIRLRGQGVSRVPGGKKGDLILNVRFRAHPIFRAEKHDLFATLKLTPWEAALGAKVAVRTLEKDVTLTIPAGTESGQRLRLKGKGLPSPGKDPGDIFYDVHIAVPKNLTEEERKYFEILAQISRFNPRA